MGSKTNINIFAIIQPNINLNISYAKWISNAGLIDCYFCVLQVSITMPTAAQNIA